MEQHIPLTSSEISILWVSYQSETMSLYTFMHFEKVVEDEDIKNIIQKYINTSQVHIEKLKEIFAKEESPAPIGYNEHDVNLQAPRLFSDITSAFLLKFIVELGMQTHANALKSSARKDIRDFSNECLIDYIALTNEVTNMLLQKGIFVRPPSIPIPDHTEFVQGTGYLTGWFGKRRPVHATQLNQLFLNVQRNILGKTLLIGFSQTVSSEKVRKHFQFGKEMSKKLLDSFELFLSDVELDASIPNQLTVTDSTKAPFSDKLMMGILLTIIRYAIVFYGESLAVSSRRDLFGFYSKIISETAVYANQTIKLAVELGYLEREPEAIDYDELT
ncbi:MULTISPECIES: DUF3231 family protein [unclassified Bacillus (in: firmicutes)]|uniref:DUF3231 family protein n=1 Tax=unclassified Bacillus (in: firmicutes) TaxID=185979 RepID=UPI0008F44756|nr:MULTISPECIES: DUF3231 family protein [unclassified Bacillus (in: firmicutes)]SFB04531.1 Protein of unknown function [Bacillus sp. UNCCL13]SFQ88492.1 Protein of unknown function [Bacillus sp. cl95]